SAATLLRLRSCGATSAATAAAFAADVAPQERSRSKVAADETARKADLLSDAADSQVAVSVRKKDAAETAVDKISARLGRAASDAADAPKSGVLAQKDGAGVLPLASMTGQVAGRVIDALGATLASQRPSDLPNEAYLRMTAGGAALKTLTIQLQPETLGKLDVSMRLVDGQLTLEIAATEAETAKVLAQDREGLRKLLQHAGFSIDEASITIVSRDNSAQPQVRAAAAGESAGAQQDTGNGGSGDPRNRGGEAEQQGRNAGRDERQKASDSRPRRSSGNYL
ncbi:MAG: flagellar hook-length control protein FliK, partial [Zymomonas sp.]